MARIKISDLPKDQKISRKEMMKVIGGSTGLSGLQDFTLAKYLDASTPDLFSACCQGSQLGEATFVFMDSGGSNTTGTYGSIGPSGLSVNTDD
ncbi:MAG: type VI secretion system tube protein Hcp [Candidatus Latescibacteria bacterium]|nr:type VI secretion system tube protein Hcp [Candidatus Latescibacterota bacterium]